MKKLAHYGPKRGGVGVWENSRAKLATVRWTVSGRRHQESFPLTRNGLLEAKAYAKGVAGGRVTGPREVSLTVRGLWLAYLDANAHSLRKASLVVYGGRWRKFEAFAAHDTPAANVGMEDLDRFAKVLLARHAPNQVAMHLQVVRLVFRWARSRELLKTSVPEHQYKLGRDHRRHEPAEYLRADFDKMVATLSPQKSREWRAWALLMLIGHQGARARSALHLRWTDVIQGGIRWPKLYDKMGREREQPLTWGALSALETARWWRERDGYVGPWVFPAGSDKGQGDQPYTVQAAWQHLRQAEERAGVAHKPFRAFHGLRKGSSGDVADATGDPWLALQWIGDTDPRRAREYVKARDERMQKAAAVFDVYDPSTERQPGGASDA